MSIFITLVFILLAVIGLFLIAGLFIQKEYNIECSVIIFQSKEKVFDYIRILNHQDYYNKWWMEEPQPHKTSTGIDGTVGFITAWDNRKNQKGEQEIKKITEGQRIDCELRFEKPFKNVADTFMSTVSVEGGTKVSWGFSGKNKYPMNAVFKVFNLEKKLGDDMLEGLNKLKTIVENN